MHSKVNNIQAVSKRHVQLPSSSSQSLLLLDCSRRVGGILKFLSTNQPNLTRHTHKHSRTKGSIYLYPKSEVTKVHTKRSNRNLIKSMLSLEERTKSCQKEAATATCPVHLQSNLICKKFFFVTSFFTKSKLTGKLSSKLYLIMIIYF